MTPKEIKIAIKTAIQAREEGTDKKADHVRIMFLKDMQIKGTEPFKGIDRIAEFSVSQVFTKAGKYRAHVTQFLAKQLPEHTVEIIPVYPSLF